MVGCVIMLSDLYKKVGIKKATIYILVAFYKFFNPEILIFAYALKQCGSYSYSLLKLFTGLAIAALID